MNTNTSEEAEMQRFWSFVFSLLCLKIIVFGQRAKLYCKQKIIERLYIVSEFKIGPIGLNSYQHICQK